MLQYCYENAAEKRQFIIERDISNMNERLERSRSAAKGQGSPAGENRAWAESGNHTHLGNGNAAVESGRDVSDV